MRKLIFVINTLQKGGAERVLSTLSNSFSERAYEVTIVCLNHAEPAYSLASAVRVLEVLCQKRKTGGIYRIIYGVKTFVRLLSILRKERPYCVIAFMTSANLWAGLSCNLLKIPYIVSERVTPDLTVNRFNLFLKWLSVWVYRKSRAVVLPAKGMEDCLRRDSIFRKLANYAIIRNPVNCFRIKSALPVHPRKFILAIGRLVPEKGFDLLIEAFSRLDIKDTDLLIIGAGPEKARLQEQITRMGLQQRIYLCGIQQDIQHYYVQAELFVLPSRNEGYPNVLIEAMSMGCACVAMDCEYGPSEIIVHGVNGILVQNGHTGELARMIATVLSNPVLRQNLSAEALAISSTNSLERIADQWEALILT